MTRINEFCAQATYNSVHNTESHFEDVAKLLRMVITMEKALLEMADPKLSRTAYEYILMARKALSDVEAMVRVGND